jgi:hypothetical protein
MTVTEKPIIQLKLDVGSRAEIRRRVFFAINGSPDPKPLMAEIGGNIGWVTRFAQACYDRGREDQKAAS